jgi:DNA modification methylase
MKLDNLSSLFQTSVRIQEMDPMSSNAVWPANTELCITRVPIRKRDGWDPKVFAEFAKKLKSTMVPNGIIFLICYAPIEAKARPFEVAKIMTDNGFNHVDNIVIKKTWFPGKRSETNLVNSHEYVLHFCNGDVWKLDRLPLRQYLKIHDELSCPGNTWEIETGSLDESYPVDLAELLIRMTNCLPGSVVFDPYCGGTGSLRAALKLGHSFFGFEQDKKQLKKYQKLVEDFNSGKLNDDDKRQDKGRSKRTDSDEEDF